DCFRFRNRRARMTDCFRIVRGNAGKASIMVNNWLHRDTRLSKRASQFALLNVTLQHRWKRLHDVLRNDINKRIPRRQILFPNAELLAVLAFEYNTAAARVLGKG